MMKVLCRMAVMLFCVAMSCPVVVDGIPRGRLAHL